MTNTESRTASTAQCCKRIYGGGRGFRGSPCSKRATVERDGEWYCTVHDPVRREEKGNARYAEWQEKWKAERKRRQLEIAAPDLLDALKGLRHVIEAAGLLNLMNGVQLGPTVWYVKASDALAAATDAIVKAEPIEPPTETGAVGDRESDATPQTVA